MTTPIAPSGPVFAAPAVAATKDGAGTAKHDAKKATKDLEFATREFEQIFVRSMLKDSPIAKKGDAYADLVVDAMAKSVTDGRGLGLGELIRRNIEKSEASQMSPKALKVSK